MRKSVEVFGLAVAVLAVASCTSANHEAHATAETTTFASSTATPADWSAFTRAANDDGRLAESLTVQSPGAVLLEPPPAGTSPSVSAAEARAQLGEWLHENGSATEALASVTTTNWGQPLPDGGFDLTVDHRSAWVVWLTGVDLASQYRGPGPAPTGGLVGQVIALIDAETGQILTTMEGPS